MKRLMLLGLALAACPASAEPRWKAELQRDLVQIQDGQYVIDRYSVCTIANAPAGAESFQTRTYAEAPVDLMSRDHVVAYLTEVNLLTVLGLTSGGAQVVCRSVREPTGPVDLETRLTMSAEGMEWKIERPDGGTETSKMSWSDVFPAE